VNEQPPIITIKGVLLSAADFNVRPSPWRRIRRLQTLALFCLAAGFFGSAAVIGSRLDPGFGDVVLMVSPLFVGLIGYQLACSALQRAAARGYVKAPIGGTPLDWSFDLTGMSQRSDAISSDIPWTSMVEVRETESAFHFVLSPYSILVLPTRFMSVPHMVALRTLIGDARARGAFTGAG
jgi:hypothetical protein